MNDDLVRRMREASELHGDFVLSSGQRSSTYFDKFRFLTTPDLLRDVAAEVATLLAPGTTLLGAPMARFFDQVNALVKEIPEE